jgi:drug/metabolite transporter (DMT)-like permease
MVDERARRGTAGVVQIAAAAILTLLVGASFAFLATDNPPWCDEWRDSQFGVGMLIGAAAAVQAGTLLQRRRFHAAVATWIWLLAIAGLILTLACWLGLVVRAVS